MTARNLNPVDVVLASAGTGKTTRLVRLIKEALEGGLRADQVLATTFTKIAAEELRERTRSQLTASGMLSAATGMLGARMGTVHSVCGNIISEFALEAGRSPLTDVLPEDAALQIFSMKADAVIARLAPTIQPAARRAGLRDEWANEARKIAELARQNGVAVAELATCADQSWTGLAALLASPVPGESAEQLDASLWNAINMALGQFPNPGDTTAKTAEAVLVLEGAAQRIGRGQELSWQDWVRLAKIDVAAESKNIVQPVQVAASAHLRHPRLRADLEALTRGIFQCAAEALTVYQEAKRQQGWLDFTDQEEEALSLVRTPEVAAILSERIGQVFVDEFQDTSPIQLAIFIELAKIARRSTWVGDPKQAIYGFRGTDPELMALASGEVTGATGGSVTVLNRSFRSRPGLVSFVNDLFVSAAIILDLPPDRIRIDDTERVDPTGMPAPLAVWRIPGNKDQGWFGLAAGVRKMLDAPGAWPVIPKGEDTPRPVIISDIAILCRTNSSARKIADALASLGIKATVGRSDLLNTLECRLAVAAIRWVADPDDRLALVEMANALDPGTAQPAWFAAVLSEEVAALEELVPIAETLAGIRSNILHLTPGEVVDAVLSETKMAVIVRRWGRPLERAENLEALRALAANYQETCRQNRAPATLTGLVAWLDELSESKSPPEQPASIDKEAVQILTYHTAKGLEWPVVIMAELDRKPAPDVFEPVAVSDPLAGAWLDPLAGRWIRYWPWPYGANQFRQKTKDTGLDIRAQRTSEWRSASQTAIRESARLLYVGMTRARDYNVFALSGTRPTAWLETLADDQGYPYLGMPPVGGDDIMVGVRNRYPARVEEFTAIAASPAQIEPAFGPPPSERAAHPPLRISPSNASAKDGNLVGYRKIELGGRLVLSGAVDMTSLGEAVHRFLAADPGPSGTNQRRIEIAEGILARWSVSALSADELILASDRLYTFIRNTWPDGTILREVPIAGRRSLQRVSGRIDLLVSSKDSLAIIDHKSFPGAEKDWPTRLSTYQAQLDAYADLASATSKQSIAGVYVYLPIVGTMLELSPGGGAEAKRDHI